MSETIGRSPEAPQRPLQGQDGKHKYRKWVGTPLGEGVKGEVESQHPPPKGSSYGVLLIPCGKGQHSSTNFLASRRGQESRFFGRALDYCKYVFNKSNGVTVSKFKML